MDDPLLFRRSFPGGSEAAALIIKRRLKSLVGATVGRMTLQELLARSELINDLGEALRKDMEAKGVHIVDVRINRTELPKKALSAVYDQMREQRRAISREYRAKGEREAREIHAKADREARTALAEAESKAELTRGEGDAQAAAIYAEAYTRDEDFYVFTRSLSAYKATLKDRTTLVLSPKETFFRYLAPSLHSESQQSVEGEEPDLEGRALPEADVTLD
jgi:membrane protease subunit HflC